MPLHSLDPREKNEDVNVFLDTCNNRWYYRRALDDVPVGHYLTESDALRAARKMSELTHIHETPCEKFEPVKDSPYCIVCFWSEEAH